MPSLERHYMVDEIAAAWSLSADTIRRLFRDEPGVLKLGEGTRLLGRKYKRRYYIMRIPQTVLDRVWSRLLQKRA